jgi:hypothetical protein
MNWFEQVFGFKESKAAVYENISIRGNFLISNQKKISFGRLEVISLKELREKVASLVTVHSKIKISEVYGSVVLFHKTTKNAIFQVASQFNLLEMYRPENTRDMGITMYQYDQTQGPACAITCAAGTLYRNYFTDINTLDNIENALSQSYWDFKNGYIFFKEVNMVSFPDEVLEKQELIKNELKVGIQWDTEVIGSAHCVSQIYCSAVPVSYNDDVLIEDIELFAKIILDSAYESTFIAGILNEKSNIVFLTLLGGGAFENNKEWIIEAIEKNLIKYKDFDLDIRFVNYSCIPDRDIQLLIEKFN